MKQLTEDLNAESEFSDKGEEVQRVLYRILPYWPVMLLGVILGFIGARIYLRYQVPVFTAKARVIVNDNTEQKSANLQEVLKLDTRNLSSETEREIQILKFKGPAGKTGITAAVQYHLFKPGKDQECTAL
ncbi:MAG: hypothetical protein QM791_20845 [Ferruginibacter sp.]